MKLIDFLIRELPENGGWPEGATEICWHGKNEVYAYFYGAGGAEFGSPIIVPQRCHYEGDANGFNITREQYEAAIAASEQVIWDGEGFPPVGVECDSLHCFVNSEWQRIIVKWRDEKQFLYEWVREGHPVHHLLGYVEQYRFRPLFAESEHKRDEAGLAIYHANKWNSEGELVNPSRMEDYKRAYDAILAGKIPHITLK